MPHPGCVAYKATLPGWGCSPDASRRFWVEVAAGVVLVRVVVQAILIGSDNRHLVPDLRAVQVGAVRNARGIARVAFRARGERRGRSHCGHRRGRGRRTLESGTIYPFCVGCDCAPGQLLAEASCRVTDLRRGGSELAALCAPRLSPGLRSPSSPSPRSQSPSWLPDCTPHCG